MRKKGRIICGRDYFLPLARGGQVGFVLNSSFSSPSISPLFKRENNLLCNKFYPSIIRIRSSASQSSILQFFNFSILQSFIGRTFKNNTTLIIIISCNFCPNKRKTKSISPSKPILKSQHPQNKICLSVQINKTCLYVKPILKSQHPQNKIWLSVQKTKPVYMSNQSLKSQHPQNKICLSVQINKTCLYVKTNP